MLLKQITTYLYVLSQDVYWQTFNILSVLLPIHIFHYLSSLLGYGNALLEEVLSSELCDGLSSKGYPVSHSTVHLARQIYSRTKTEAGFCL